MKKKSMPSAADNKNNKQDQELEALNYPPSQDIMNRGQKLDIDPDAIPGRQAPYSTHEGKVPENVNYQQEEDNLDIPGAELDDANEMIGEEDEENNYYSLSKNDEQDSDGSAGAFDGTEEVKE